MRSSGLRLLLLGLVFCISLLLLAPASLLGSLLERLSGGALQLTQSQGSMWHGSGTFVYRHQTQYISLGHFQWRALLPSPSGLLGLSLQGTAPVPLTVRLSLQGQAQIDNLSLTLPASVLDLIAPQLAPYGFQGTLQAQAGHLTLDTQGMQGQVQLDWRDASSALSDVRPLGTYRIVLRGEGQRIDTELTTLEGRLRMQGQGPLDIRSGLTFNGTAQAADGAATEELNALLHHIGPEMRPGIYTIVLAPQTSQYR